MNYAKNKDSKVGRIRSDNPLSGMGRTEVKVLLVFKDYDEIQYPDLVRAAYPDLDYKSADSKVKSAAGRLKKRGLLLNEEYKKWEISEAGRQLFIQKQPLKSGWDSSGKPTGATDGMIDAISRDMDSIMRQKEAKKPKPLRELAKKYDRIVIFDTETSGLDSENDRIIELAALVLEPAFGGGKKAPEGEQDLFHSRTMDYFVKLPEGMSIPERIIELTGITNEQVEREGVSHIRAACEFHRCLIACLKTLVVAHNAQFDLCFSRSMFAREGLSMPQVDVLDTMTVFKDRRPYPHTLKAAIDAYELTDQVKNSHRAIDDVEALFEVLKAMAAEEDNLTSYVNLIGYNPRYGVSGTVLDWCRYEPQPYGKKLIKKVEG